MTIFARRMSSAVAGPVAPFGAFCSIVTAGPRAGTGAGSWRPMIRRGSPAPPRRAPLPSRPVDPEVARLASLLDELAALLRAHSETRWAEWVAKDAALVRRGDAYGLTHFLSAFGGMG